MLRLTQHQDEISITRVIQKHGCTTSPSSREGYASLPAAARQEFQSISEIPPVDHSCDPNDRDETHASHTHTSESGAKRTAIPDATLPQIFSRADHRCEWCGRNGGRLDVHHRDPVSKGGSNDTGTLNFQGQTNSHR